MTYIEIDGATLESLVEALIDAYPAPGQMQQFLQYRLDKRLFALVANANLQQMYFELIVHQARPNGWLDDLIFAALESKPGHPGIQAVAQRLGLTAFAHSEDEDPEDTLQRIIDDTGSFLDPAPWRERLGFLERQICRIEIPRKDGKTAYGTGFLLGEDVLITNYHVLKAVYDGEAEAQEVRLRFDFKVLSTDGGQTVTSQGTVFHLADEWNLDHSPYSKMDSRRDPKPHDPDPEELDYALVRIADQPGSQPVGGKENAEPGATRRGWIPLPEPSPRIDPDMAILVLQHPEGDPIRFAMPPGRVLRHQDTGPLNGNGTRIRYSTNTLAGSSGSPCFDSDWKLLALHHAGDPNFEELHQPEYNQGIPFPAILRLLEQRGKRDLLPD